MTDDEAKDLGLRALKAGFRWAPGCMARRQTGPCFGGHRYTDGNIREGRVFLGGWPDFRDSATLGVLVAQAEGVWVGRPFHPDGTPPIDAVSLEASWDHDSHTTKWCLLALAHRGLQIDLTDEFDSKAEALVAALEAAKEDR